MRAIPTAAAIEAPAIVYRTDSEGLFVRPAVSFSVGDLLACVFSDFSSSSETLRCEAAVAVNVGALYR